MAFRSYEPETPSWPLSVDDQLWLAPAIGNPSVDPDATAEPRDKWYERQRVFLQATEALPTVDGESIFVSNNSVIEWDPAAEDWGTLTHVAIMAGKRPLAFTTVIGYAALTASLDGLVAVSDVLTIPKGALRIKLERVAGVNTLLLGDADNTATATTFHNFFRAGGTLGQGGYTIPDDLAPAAPVGYLLAGPGVRIVAGDNAPIRVVPLV